MVRVTQGTWTASSSSSSPQWGWNGCVIQYHRPDEQDGMITAFRRQESPYDRFVCDLHEIDPVADYRVMRSYTYGPSMPVGMKGSELQRIKVEIDDRPGSLIIEYKKIRR